MTSKRFKSDPHAAREAEQYERPIPSREFILNHLSHRPEPASYTDLEEELGLVGDEVQQEALHRRIKAMLRDGQLERLRGGYLAVAQERVLVEGTVFLEKGKQRKIWVLPKDDSARIYLGPESIPPVYTGNQVIVAAVESAGSALRTGRLVEILSQQPVLMTGRFVQEMGFCHVIPHTKELLRDILIPQDKTLDAIDGQMVVVELLQGQARWAEPLGKVVEILGAEDRPGIEVEAVIRAYELPHQWSTELLAEAAHYGTTVPTAAKRGRLDLRALPFVTIDGEDAKDFDDAVYCESKREGGFKLMVAIADVSYYVQPGSLLDREARLRGNSVYFPGHVVPMLPEALSNELCSLKPNVDRLCLVCTLSISAQGKVTRHEFHEAIICSKRRLTYTQVWNLLSATPEQIKKHDTADQEILPHLKRLQDLYHVLRSARVKRGAIEFESVETRLIFDTNQKISRIIPVERNEAHRLIEECMLCANVACARFLMKHELPGLYRNHQGPTPEKLTELRQFLAELALHLEGGDDPTPLDYARLLQDVQKRPDASIIQTVLLRSLSQAVYAKDNLGHFGLAYPFYCHFTSPIRRYPDLLVHRQIRTILRSQWTDKKQKQVKSDHFQKGLVDLAEHLSMTERRADDATRDVTRWLKCQYMRQHVGEIFSGVISGVTRFGFFVELKEIYIDGLVHVTSLKNDYYYFDPIHHRLIGERSGTHYKIGDVLQVKVARVEVDERKIDFELLDQPVKNNPTKAASKKHKKKSASKRPRKASS